MAPEPDTQTIPSAGPSAPGGGSGTGIPLITLVLSGALRLRRDGEEPGEPARESG